MKEGAFFLLLAILPCSAVQTLTPPKASVEGTVIDALTEQPLRKAHVTLAFANDEAIADDRNDDVPSTTTDDNGRFTFEDLDGGKYILSAEKLGYLGFPTRDFSGDSDERILKLNLSANQALSSVQLKLTPQGVISGRVVDNDGDPCEQCSVGLLRRVWQKGKQEIKSVEHGSGELDDRAEFRFAGLSPGRYYLFANSEATPGSGVHRDSLVTYYPNVLDVDRASAIFITVGQQISDLELRLQQGSVYSISGKVVGLDSWASFDNAQQDFGPHEKLVFAKYRGSMHALGDTQSTLLHGDGTFVIRGVAPGSYDVTLTQNGAGPATLARTPVEVGGRDVTGVVVQVSPPGTLTGKVELDSGKIVDLTMPTVYLIDDREDYIANTRPKSDGSFEFANLIAGRYQVGCGRLPDSTYLKSILFGNVAITEAGFEWVANSEAGLRILISAHPAQVSGHIESSHNSDGKSDTGSFSRARVVVVPSVPDTPLRDDRIKSTKVNVNGDFTVKGLAPGSYQIYAFEQVEADAWLDEDFLRQLGNKSTEVTVRADESARIALLLIPAKLTEDALAKAGIQ